jgi:hypothetical protein
MFGYLFAWTGSIWVPVTAHFVNNTIAVAFYFFYNRGLIGDDLNTIGSEKGSIAYTLSSIIFLVVMMGAIRIAEKRKANRYQEPVA